MKKILVTLSVLSFALFSYAQTTFQRAIGGGGYEVGTAAQQTIDGGYIVSGHAVGFGPIASSAFYLIKTNPLGDTVWTKIFGTGDYCRGNDAQQTNDGGYILTGMTQTFGTAPDDVYLVKTNAAGDTLWTKTYGFSNFEYALSVQQTADSGYILAGKSTFIAGWDLYVIKTNAMGDTLWTRSYGGTSGLNSAERAQQTSDGGFIIAGSISYSGSTKQYVCLIKTNSTGDTLWTKIFNRAEASAAYWVEQTSDGGYIITGASVFSPYQSAILIKTNATGVILWTKAYHGINDNKAAYQVHQTTDGGYIMVGTTFFTLNDGDVFLIKTNSLGDTLWTRTYGGIGIDGGKSVRQTSDGGYVVAGTTESFGSGNPDIYFIKTDSLGNSGCNEGSLVTWYTPPVFTDTIAPLQVYTGSTFTNHPHTLLSSGGSDIALCLTSGIDETTVSNQLTISPNPSQRYFIVSFPRVISKGKIEIFNTFGNILLTENIYNESRKEIHLKNISDGIYFVKVFDGEKMYCKKIIIE